MENNEKDEFFDPPLPPQPAQTPAKMKAVRIAALVLGAILIAVAAFLGGWYGQYYSLDEEVRTYLWAKSVLEKDYYQPIEEAELYERLFDSLSVDPYTRFYSAQEYQAYEAEGAGENLGTGLSFLKDMQDDSRLQIFSVTENSPACKAGIRKGMYLIGFGGTENDLVSGTYADFSAYLSAQKGEFILRCGYAEDGSDARNYPIKKESYQASFLYYRDSESSFRFQGEGAKPVMTETHEPIAGLDGETAYLRLEEFSGNNTPSEIVACLTKMKERGRKNLIIDIRSNGGGYLGLFGDIASHLMRNATETHPVVVTTRTRDGEVTRYVCVQNDFSSYFSEDSKVYVLADEYTASASECLLGVLIDYGTCSYSDIYLREDANGTAKTFGKGIMQTHIKGKNGEVMKLTTATVSWPLSGKCIHGVGITKADGAKTVAADLIWGERDVMLEEVIADICG